MMQTFFATTFFFTLVFQVIQVEKGDKKVDFRFSSETAT